MKFDIWYEKVNQKLWKRGYSGCADIPVNYGFWQVLWNDGFTVAQAVNVALEYV